MTKVVGIGAGGHARVVLDILVRAGGFEIVGFTDSDPARKGAVVEGFRVLGDDRTLKDLLRQGVRHAFLGIGGVSDNAPRAAVYEKACALGLSFVKAIHPAAVVASSANIGNGVALMAMSVLNPGVRLGENVIVNTGAIVDHDCILGNHVHIAPGATLSGGIVVGDGAHIGIGASIVQGVRIGRNAVIGAGAVVIRDVPEGATVVGIPAHAIVRAGAH